MSSIDISHPSIAITSSSRRIGVYGVFVISALLTWLLFESSFLIGESNVQSRVLLTGPLFLSILTIFLAFASPGDRTFLLLVGIYNTVFLLVPALLQTSINIFPMYGGSYTPAAINATIGIIFVFELFFLVTYFYSARAKAFHAASVSLPIIYSTRKCVAVIIFLFLLVAIAFLAAGADTFLSRRAEVQIENSPFNVVIIYAGRFAGYFSFVIATLVLLAKRRGPGGLGYWGLWALAFSIYLLMNNPMNVPRFILFGSFVSLVCVFANTNSTIFKVGLFVLFGVGITTIFPMLSVLSRRDLEAVFSLIAGGPLFYLARSGDLDGFQSIANTYLMVQNHGLTLGRHLLADVLVFIPRSIWASKPYGTGVDAAFFVGYKWVNVSGPLPCEFFVDFGWIGTALGGALVGKVCSSLERQIRMAKACGDRFLLFVPATVAGFVIIVMRGSLLGVVAQVLLGVIMAWRVSVACRVKCP